MGAFKTPFTDAVVTEHPDPGGAGHANETNGMDVLGGRSGTPGIMAEVTTVDLAGAPAPWSSGLDKSAGVLGSQSGRTSPDLSDK